MRFPHLLTGCLLLLPLWPAAAQTPATDPSAWKRQLSSAPTQVLTLGSAHLSHLSVPVTPEMMAPLLSKLAAFKPEVITYEGISGEQCDLLRRYAETYPQMFDTYCWGTDNAVAATGLSVAQAMAEISRTLAVWPAKPSPAQRRRLAAVFLAAGDSPSAQVQWLQLPTDERRLGDGVDAALLKQLTRAGAKPNENFEVAVALAVRLGLQRVYAVDDHTADSVQALAGPGFDAALQKHWQALKVPAADAIQAQEKSLGNGSDMLALYRAYNRPATLRAFVEADFRNALDEPSPQQYGRQYVAWYEVRNLRMVANVRAAFGNAPGARVLNVVGASHKAFYDHYLKQMSDVQLVDAEKILR